MDGARFDRIARTVAAAPSRRALLAGAAAAVLSGLSARLPWPPATSAAAAVCPVPPPCTACEFDAGAGTLDCAAACEQPLATAELCAVATAHDGLQALDRHLRAVEYRPTEAAEAFLIQADHLTIMSVLTLPMTHASQPARTAIVVLIRGEGKRTLVAALLRMGDETVATLTVDADGTVHEHRAPATSPGTPAPETPVAQRFGSFAAAQVASNPCVNCEWCDILCSVPAEIIEFIACEAVATRICGASVPGGPPGVAACFAIVTVLCALGVTVGCQVACGNVVDCAECDLGCQSRDATDCSRCIDDCLSRQPGTVCCQGQCTDPALFAQDDVNNCGACGNACVAGHMCCSGECVRIQDPEHCGTCDGVCAPGEACEYRSEDRRMGCGGCSSDLGCAPCQRCEYGVCVDFCSSEDPCHVCDRTTGTCRSTCGPCEFCNAPLGVCQPLDTPFCRSPDEEPAAPTATPVCSDGQQSCPSYLYGCCPEGEFCCPEDMNWCCPEGCTCCGTMWCCCDNKRCSEFITGCE